MFASMSSNQQKQNVGIHFVNKIIKQKKNTQQLNIHSSIH